MKKTYINNSKKENGLGKSLRELDEKKNSLQRRKNMELT